MGEYLKPNFETQKRYDLRQLNSKFETELPVDLQQAIAVRMINKMSSIHY